MQNDGTWRHSATKYLRQPSLLLGPAPPARRLRRDGHGGRDDARRAARARDEAPSGKLGGLSEDADLAAAKAARRGAAQRPRLRAHGPARRGGQPARSEGSQEPAPVRAVPDRHRQGDRGGRPAASRWRERLPKNHPEFAEATGLLGRAYKQIFFDAGDKTSPGAREALKQAIAAYRRPLRGKTPGRTPGTASTCWRCSTRARRLGLRIAPDLKPKEIARTLVAGARGNAAGEARRMASCRRLAEASLGLEDWDYGRAQHPRLCGGRRTPRRS